MKGNRCEHERERPKFAHVDFHPNAPKIIKQTCMAAKRAYLSHRRDFLPALDVKARKRRSERREAICAVIFDMMPKIDLSTLHYGVPNGKRGGGTTGHYRYARVSDRTGLHEVRIARALKDLKEAGYINTWCRYVRYKGFTFAVLKLKIEKKLLIDLGIREYAASLKIAAKRQFDKWLDHDKKHARISETTQSTLFKIGGMAVKAVGATKAAALLPDFVKNPILKAKTAKTKPPPAKRNPDEVRLATQKIGEALKEGITIDQLKARVNAPKDIDIVGLYRLLSA